jgi:hypothetical protein
MFRSSQGLVDLLGSSIFFLLRDPKKKIFVHEMEKEQHRPKVGEHNLFDPYIYEKNTESTSFFSKRAVLFVFFIPQSTSFFHIPPHQ